MSAPDLWSDDELATSARYTRPLRRARLLRGLVALPLVLGYVILSGPARLLDVLGIGHWVPAVLLVMLSLELLLLPVVVVHDGWRDLVHDRRFGRSSLTVRDEALNQCKALVFRIAIHSAVLIPVFWLLRNVSAWWIPAWLLLILLGNLLALLGPRLAPRLKPSVQLTAAVEDPLCRSSAAVGLPIDGVESFDDLRQPRPAAGYLVGGGGARRLVVHSSRLDLPPPVLDHAMAEITAPRALGHQRVLAVTEAGLGLILFGSLAAVTRQEDLLTSIDVTGPGDPAILPLLMVTALVARLVSQLIKGAIARELVRRGDDHVLVVLDDPESFLAARRHTAELIRDDLDPRGWDRLRRMTPSAAERMTRALDRSGPSTRSGPVPPPRTAGRRTHRPASEAAR